MNSVNSAPTNLKEISYVFLKLGATAFGGPAAHIAMMEEELVHRRNWLSKEDFLDLISTANLIPGPNSTEVAIHVGYKMAGWRGLIIAGSSFIIPAFLIVWALAWFYVKFGTIPAFQSVFIAIKPVILAVIAQAIWSLSRSAIRDRTLALFSVIALSLFLFGYNEILILLFIAIANVLVRKTCLTKYKNILFLILIPTSLIIFLEKAVAQVNDAFKVPIEAIFGYFVKVGSVLFGSGYVLIAFLQNDLVQQYRWITDQQLVDAIAVGQFTPGPVFTTATFIGYLVSGNVGAISATVGIFLPAFFFVAVSAPFIATLRKSKWTALMLDGLNVASLSLMAGAGLLLSKEFLVSPFSLVVFTLSLISLIKFRVNSVWIILGAGILGILGVAA